MELIAKQTTKILAKNIIIFFKFQLNLKFQ